MSNPVKIVGPESTSSAKITPPSEAVYANVNRVFATPNEVILDFAMNINAFGPLVEEDAKIVSYLLDKPEVSETIDKFADLLLYLLPKYKREGKSYLTIGIGCTGGKHRSVMVANSLRKTLRRNGFDTSVSHRDIQK